MRILLGLAAFAALLPGLVSGATIGSFSASRTCCSSNFEYHFEGNQYDNLRQELTTAGHSIAAGTGTIDSSYLANVDLFFTGALDNSSLGIISGAEQSALRDWVSAGGILFSVGENSSFTGQYNSLLNPFGITVLAGNLRSASWVDDPSNPLLANGVAGSELPFVAGGSFVFEGGLQLLATSSAEAVGVSTRYGSGLVVAIGDANFIDDAYANAASYQFMHNVLESSVVPIPAAVWLFGSSLVGLVWRGRRRN